MQYYLALSNYEILDFAPYYAFLCDTVEHLSSMYIRRQVMLFVILGSSFLKNHMWMLTR